TAETTRTPAGAVFSEDECRQFATDLLHRHQDCQGAIAWHASSGTEAGSGPSPQSAVAVRLRPSQPGWIFALSLRPELCLGEAEVRLISLAAAMLLKHPQHARLANHVKTALFDLVRCLSAVIDARDPCTAGHSERVSRIAVRIGREMDSASTLASDLHLA